MLAIETTSQPLPPNLCPWQSMRLLPTSAHHSIWNSEHRESFLLIANAGPPTWLDWESSDGCAHGQSPAEALFLLPPHVPLRISSPYPANLLTLELNPNAFSPHLLPVDWPCLGPRFAFTDPRLFYLLRTLEAESKSGYPLGAEFGDILCRAICLQLVPHHPDHHLPKPPCGLPTRRLRRVLAHLEQRLTEDIDVAELALVAGMSPHYFSRLFKQSMGLSPRQYVIQQRIAKAKYLLRSTAESITGIGSDLGFPTPSHFTATFRKHTGLTPREYRHQVLEFSGNGFPAASHSQETTLHGPSL